MYTKQVLFIVSLIILVAMFNTAWACHESDTGLRGHNPDLRFTGISVVTEAAFALTSTTTGCDQYTYFIQQSYHQIAENAARGEGEYLEAFAHFNIVEHGNRFSLPPDALRAGRAPEFRS